ncbi:hypothetical protein B0I35DRAFT_482150 [Stachybotrys elegans]|uniref:Uncharacterized protein n=1 Tax=Stachybotrys elegans TaxID=80388 RepID=A0A8K0SNZ6_9HYPO|nr:hypothetical protein B0I35DRAFT_482150 [Stachybotrys elegans]
MTPRPIPASLNSITYRNWSKRAAQQAHAREDSDEAVRRVNARIQGLLNETAALTPELSQVTAEAANFAAERLALQEEISAWRKALKNDSAELAAEKKAHQDAVAQMQALQNDAVDLTAERDLIKEQLAAKDKELTTKVEELTANDKGLTAAKRNLSKVLASNKAMDVTLATKDQELATVQNTLSDTKTALEDKSSTLATVQKTLDETQDV